MVKTHFSIGNRLLGGAISAFLLAAGCGGSAASPAQDPSDANGQSTAEATEAERALAEMYPTQRSEVSGTIVVRKTNTGVHLAGRINGLPAGSHAFAIHENGDCSAHDAKSVGGLFNPTEAAEAPGMLGDVKTKEAGKTEVELSVSGLEMSGPNSVVGRALVIHAWPHDPSAELETVPYLACGVIRPR